MTGQRHCRPLFSASQTSRSKHGNAAQYLLFQLGLLELANLIALTRWWPLRLDFAPDELLHVDGAIDPNFSNRHLGDIIGRLLRGMSLRLLDDSQRGECRDGNAVAVCWSRGRHASVQDDSRVLHKRALVSAKATRKAKA